MEAMHVFIKYGRDDGGGDSNWNPALHPRTGTPPNPGWFAPTGGAAGESLSVRTAQNDDPTRRLDASSPTREDWIRLPPGPKRIDELSDLVERILNARAEDAPAISAEIDRYFWESAAHDLKNMLAVLIRPGITNADRRTYLNRLDIYTRADPAWYVPIFNAVTGIATGIGRAPPAAGEHGGADAATGEAETPPARAAELPERNPTPTPSHGGRLGSPATRAQNAEIAADLKKKGFIITGGGGGMAEEYIRGAGPGTLGGTYVDITAVNEETGATIRVQTIDTLANGSPTPRETAAAERIRRAFPNDTLVLIPKRSAQ